MRNRAGAGWPIQPSAFPTAGYASSGGCYGGSARYCCVVDGPNSGGKTPLLQAIVMVQCLGQAGMFVSVARAQLVCAPTSFVSLVDEVVAAQTEGRLGHESK